MRVADVLAAKVEAVRKTVDLERDSFLERYVDHALQSRALGKRGGLVDAQSSAPQPYRADAARATARARESGRLLEPISLDQDDP